MLKRKRSRIFSGTLHRIFSISLLPKKLLNNQIESCWALFDITLDELCLILLHMEILNILILQSAVEGKNTALNLHILIIGVTLDNSLRNLSKRLRTVLMAIQKIDHTLGFTHDLLTIWECLHLRAIHDSIFLREIMFRKRTVVKLGDIDAVGNDCLHFSVFLFLVNFEENRLVISSVSY